MNKRSERITLLLQLLLAVAVTVTLWNGWRGAALNQRYERSIQRYEQSTADFINYLESTKAAIQDQID